MSNYELQRTHYVSEDYYVIYPQVKTGREYNHSNNRLIIQLSSETNIKSKEYLIELLKDGGYL
jgi:hypothetical protein